MIIVREFGISIWNMDFIKCYVLSIWPDFQIGPEGMDHKN
jgi:hypothetical protein